MSDSHSHPAYTEGFDSYMKNHGALINPYPIGTPEHNDFERGWIQCQKRMPESRPKRSGQVNLYQVELVKKRKEQEILKAKEAYKKGKGR
jgi:predicted phosphoribosyltransferase